MIPPLVNPVFCGNGARVRTWFRQVLGGSDHHSVGYVPSVG